MFATPKPLTAAQFKDPPRKKDPKPENWNLSELICPICEKPFKAVIAKQTYCSTRCSRLKKSNDMTIMFARGKEAIPAGVQAAILEEKGRAQARPCIVRDLGYI
jgi:hypothetical protein